MITWWCGYDAGRDLCCSCAPSWSQQRRCGGTVCGDGPASAPVAYTWKTCPVHHHHRPGSSSGSGLTVAKTTLHHHHHHPTRQGACSRMHHLKQWAKVRENVHESCMRTDALGTHLVSVLPEVEIAGGRGGRIGALKGTMISPWAKNS